MKIVRTVKAMKAYADEVRRDGKTVALVPTMGSLHEGHLSLIRLARREADVVVVSIYVNPTQFGPQEDFKSYPRDWERDEALCHREQAGAVFYPPDEEMYGSQHSVYVTEHSLSKTLCGASRPEHFQGVCTIVAKLFNIVQPHVAVFGRKDAQQLRIIEQMTCDLNFPVTIVPGEIVREEDGLAMSSRNRRLSVGQRRQALSLSRALDAADRLFQSGIRSPVLIKEEMRSVIGKAEDARIDYIEAVDLDTLQSVDQVASGTLIALAVFIGSVRLIDNRLLCSQSS